MFQLAWFPTGKILFWFVVVTDDVFKVFFGPKTLHDEISGHEGQVAKKRTSAPSRPQKMKKTMKAKASPIMTNISLLKSEE